MVALASKATLLVMGGWATASVLRQRSAAERHVVWVAFFCGLLLLPILERRGPVVATRRCFRRRRRRWSNWRPTWANRRCPAAVPDATVLVTGPDTLRQEITRSGPDGRFDFPLLREGKYAIEVRARGFAIYRGAATVEAGRSLEENLSLGLGRVQENIDVVGKKPSVQNTGQPVGAPRRIRVGGNVQATKLLRMVKPPYPAELQALGIEGTVLLEGVIGINGKLLSMRRLNTLVHPELTKAALAAVNQWEYQATLLNGQPAEVVTTITVNFRLAD